MSDRRPGGLAVAISTLDRPASLARCLDALWAGAVRPAEVIIVDQSQDVATRGVVEARAERGLPVVYVQQAARGLAASQNAAVARATRPLVAVLDDDCVPDREWLGVMAGALASPDGLAAVTGRVLPLSPDGDRAWPVSSRTSTRRVEFRRRRAPWLVGSGNNFAVRRDRFLGVGGCDERLGPGSPGQGGVDMDLFYRLLRAGGRIRYEPDAVVYHERQTRQGRLARRSMYGHGMGACCGLWVRQGDLHALGVLAHWLAYRVGRLGRATGRRRWTEAHEELLVLAGTASGVVYGLRT